MALYFLLFVQKNALYQENTLDLQEAGSIIIITQSQLSQGLNIHSQQALDLV